MLVRLSVGKPPYSVKNGLLLDKQSTYGNDVHPAIFKMTLKVSRNIFKSNCAHFDLGKSTCSFLYCEDLLWTKKGFAAHTQFISCHNGVEDGLIHSSSKNRPHRGANWCQLAN